MLFFTSVINPLCRQQKRRGHVARSNFSIRYKPLKESSSLRTESNQAKGRTDEGEHRPKRERFHSVIPAHHLYTNKPR